MYRSENNGAQAPLGEEIAMHMDPATAIVVGFILMVAAVLIFRGLK